MLDVIVGFVIAVPMLVGMLGYPWAVWQRLARRYLRGRGVALWRKVMVALIALAPAVMTLLAFSLLRDLIGVGGSSDDWQRARDIAPRAIPVEAYPMALGMLIGLLVTGPLLQRFSHYLPYFNVPSTPLDSTPNRTQLHPIEQHIQDELLSGPVVQVDAIAFTELPAIRQTPRSFIRQRYRRLSEYFFTTQFQVVAKRQVQHRPVRVADLDLKLNTVIIAADEDCLRQSWNVRAPLVTLTGDALLSLLKPNTSILLHLPGLSVTFSPADLEELRSELT